METVTSVLVVSLAIIAICVTALNYGLLCALREKIRLVHEIVNLVDSKTNDLNAKIDIVKSLYDSLDDGQARLKSNVDTLTDLKGGCPYTPNGLCSNPHFDCIGCPNHGTSGVITTTATTLHQPETIGFTEE